MARPDAQDQLAPAQHLARPAAGDAAISTMFIKSLLVLVLGFGVGFSPVHTRLVVASGRFGMFQDVSGLLMTMIFAGAPACRGGQLPAVRAEEVVPLPTGLGLIQRP